LHARLFAVARADASVISWSRQGENDRLSRCSRYVSALRCVRPACTSCRDLPETTTPNDRSVRPYSPAGVLSSRPRYPLLIRLGPRQDKYLGPASYLSSSGGLKVALSISGDWLESHPCVLAYVRPRRVSRRVMNRPRIDSTCRLPYPAAAPHRSI